MALAYCIGGVDVLDYALYPPEHNSLRMYTGPGATSLAESAVAWQAMAAELTSAATSWQATITTLTTTWSGPSALTMATAAGLYQSWLTRTAIQCEQTANQAWIAVAAYEAAFAATVPPPVVVANRTQLASLVATNFLGINTAAIMATETEYMEYWAQDATAMYEYQASSTQATAGLTQFTAAPAVTKAIPSVTPNTPASTIGSFFNNPFVQTVNNYGANVVSGGSFNPTNIIGLLTGGHDFFPGQYPGELAPTLRNLFSEPSAVAAGVAPPQTAAVEASMGRAVRVGGLSLPPSFTTSLASRTLPTSVGIPLSSTPGPGSAPMMPLGFSQNKGNNSTPRYGIRHTIMTRPPSGG